MVLGRWQLFSEVAVSENSGRRLVVDDLDSGDLDVTSDLETVDVMRLGTVSVGGEAFAIDEDLESVFFVADLKVESDGLFERELSFTLLISPFVGKKGVADNSLLVESRVEMKSNISVLLQQVDMESLALLLGDAVDDQGLAWGDSFSGDSTFIRHGVVTASPVDVRDEDISVDGEVADGGEGNTVFVFLDFFLIGEDLELVVVSTDSEVDVISLLPWVGFSLFLSPFVLGEGVEDEFSFIETDRDVKRDIVSREVGRGSVKIDSETDRIFGSFALDNQGLSWFEGLGELRSIRDRVVRFESHGLVDVCDGRLIRVICELWLVDWIVQVDFEVARSAVDVNSCSVFVRHRIS